MDDTPIEPWLEIDGQKAWALHELDAFAKETSRMKGKTWIVEAEWAHPFWDCYAISAANLGPIDGLPDPIIYVPGATVEIVVYALDPERGLLATLRKERPLAVLMPPNFAAQLHPRDGDPFERIEQAVRDVLARRLNPDTDFRRDWIARFGDNMVRR